MSMYTVKEFCQVARISASQWKRYKRDGHVPRLTKIGPRKTLISHEAAENWFRSLEVA